MNTDRLLMLDLSGPALTPDERAFLAEHPVGGVCLFARNIRDRFQLADYTAELRELCGEEFLVAVDQEGGSVLRLLDVPYSPGAMALGAADDADLTRNVAAAMGRGLRAVGVNVDFAPVADVNNNPANPVITDRSFGTEPERVAEHVAAFVQGLQAAGVAATVKHFPGHGDTATDSHLALPRLDVTRERLERLELIPFKAAIAAHVAAVMSAHILLPQLDGAAPATLSRRILTGLLRDKLGFDGVIFTDALNMKAIADAYDPTEAALCALAAGADMPLHIGPLAEHQNILKGIAEGVAAGRLVRVEVERSLQRLERLSKRYPPRPDSAAAWEAGDEALLEEAARRAVVKLGAFRALEQGSSLYLVAAARTEQGAAANAVESPAAELARLLQRGGFEVRSAFYDREALRDDQTLIVPARQADATLFVSTARTRMGEEEKALAHALADAARRFVHVALWNPYAVLDVPGPALVSFGFRPVSAKAVAAALASGEASGRSPIPLEPASRERS
jgi:beta-N-acetylhexosaminidase